MTNEYEDLRVAYWVLNKALMDIESTCKQSPAPSIDSIRTIASGALYEGAVLADYEKPLPHT